jgi:hypothetical protein
MTKTMRPILRASNQAVVLQVVVSIDRVMTIEELLRRQAINSKWPKRTNYVLILYKKAE